MVDIDPLTELTIKLSRQNLSEDKKNIAICTCIKKTVPQANRISLWRFEDDRQTIRCVMRHEGVPRNDVNNMVLRQAQFPAYFDTILKNELVVASDARSHPDTTDFTESYLEPNKIYSVLDFMFHQNFKPVGLLSCEAVGRPVKWGDRDIAVMKRAAGIISMFYPG
ncbi:hypothetical protein CA267_014855 [Alteromonas pelagimontana]|uniref:GAF domain-containing protein n=1 Tax=Alteromonas pelagimontana TaxID=1858656 RepID=A0A6M4MFU0_9ALTE|nr:hypothetical protein [Alteromonas pelagimontana]QJR81943.1 hypothetical protein CA267_014855 [Alteromonas pelagimontana]